jgi:hypothetical protein
MNVKTLKNLLVGLDDNMEIHLLLVDDPEQVGDGIYSEPAVGVSIDGNTVTILNAKGDVL